MVNWYCASWLCFNNFCTKDENQNSIKFYKISMCKEIQRQYKKLLKTEGANMNKGHICCEVDGVRRNSDHLPEIIVPQTQIAKFKTKNASATENLKRCPNSAKFKLSLKT